MSHFLIKVKHPFAFLASIFLCLVLSFSASAVIKTSSNTTWVAASFGGTLPATGDTVIINSNMTGGPSATLTLARLVVNSGFTFTHTTRDLIISGGLLVNGTYQLQDRAISVNGTTTVNGILSDNNASGLNRFDGLFTVSGTGLVSNTSNPAFEFRGGITNNGSFTISGTGVTTFSTTASQTIQGNALTFGPVTVATGVTLATSGTVPVTINGNLILTGSINFTGAGTTTLNASTCSGAGNATVQDLVLTGTSISQTGTFTVLGTTTSTGTSPITATAGLKQFRGLVTVTSGTMSSSSTAPLEFRQGILATGVFNQSGAGTVAFTGTQTLSGAAAVTFTGAATASASLTLDKSAGAIAFGSTLTVTNNLTLSTASSATVTGVGLISGNLIINSGSTLSPVGNNFTVTGTTDITGSFTDATTGGLNRFVGLVTNNLGGSFTNSSNPAYEFRGGITNNGTFAITGTGLTTFSTNAQALAGAGNISLSNVTINTGIVLTNNSDGIVTFGGTSTINGTFTDGVDGGSFVYSNTPAAGVLTIAAGGTLSSTTSSAITFSSTGGIVNAGTINITGLGSVAFSNSQTISGAGNITLPAVTVNGGFTLTISNTGTKLIYGNFNVLSTATLSVTSASGNLVIVSNLENAGTVTLGACTVSITGFLNSTAGTITNGAGGLTVNESVALSGAAILTLNTGNFSVVNATTLSGTAQLTDANATGTNTFGGLVTVGSGCTFSSASDSPYDFRAGIACEGTVNLGGTGNKSFTTFNQNLTGAGAISIAPINIPATRILTNLSSGIVTLGSATASTIAGTYLDGDDVGSNVLAGLINISAGGTLSGNTTSAWSLTGATITNSGTLSITGTGVITSTSASTIAGTSAITLNNLTVPATITFTLSNSAAKTISANCTVAGTFANSGATGLLTVGGNLAVTGTFTNGAAGTLVNGSVNLSGTGTVNFNNGNFTAGTTFNMVGTSTASDGNNTGTNTFSGLVTVGSGCSFTNPTTTGTFDFRGGITNNGTFSLASGTCNFTTNNQVIQGSLLAINTAVIAAGITVSSSGAVPVTFGATLTLTGNIDFTGAGTTTLNATAFTGAGNAIFQTLVLNGVTNSQTGTLTVLGTTSSTGTSAISATAGLKKFIGLVTVTSGTLSSSSTAPLEFQGGMAATGAFNQSGLGAVAFTGAQTISGTGAVTFTGAATATGTLSLDKTAGTVTFNGTLSPITSFVLLSNTTCTLGAGALFSGNLTVPAGTTLNLSGSAATTVAGTSTIDGTMTCGTTGTVTLGGAIALSGSLNLNTSNFIASSSTTLSGTATLTDNSTTGVNNLFIGLVTVGTGCTFNNTGNPPSYEFRGGITNNGTFAITGTGLTTFSTNNQVLQGSNLISFTAATVATGITVSSSGAVPVTFNGALTATGNIDFTGAGNTTLNAIAFTGAGNAIFQTLVLNGGTNTQTGTMTVLGTTSVITANLVISATAGLKRFNGLLSIPTGITMTVNNNAPLQFDGGLTSAGTFNQSGTGAVSFTGSQTIAGAGAVSFAGAVTTTEDLILSKTTGAVNFIGNITSGDTLYLISTTTCNISGVASLGNLSTLAGTTLNIGASNFTVSGTSTLGGLVVDGAGGGVDTFTGAFSILSGGELRELAGVSSSNWTFGSTFNNAGTFNNTSTGSVITFNGDVVNTGTFTRTGANAAVVLNSNLSFTSSGSINITSGGLGCALTVNGNATIDLGDNNFTIAGDLNVNTPGSLTILSTGAFNVGGASTITGTLDLGASVFTATGISNINGSGSIVDGDDAGTNTFTGAVTIAAATGSLSSSNNSPYNFGGGIANAGNLNLSGTGTLTFTNNQTLSGAGAYQLQNFTVPATRTLTVAATGTKTVSEVVSNAGTISHTAASGTLNFGGTLTNSGTLSGGAAPIIVAGTLNNSGSVTVAAGSFTMSDYTASGNFTNGAGGTTVNGAVNLSGTANINMSSGNFSALSTTNLSGTSTITDANSAGSNLFTGLLTVGSACSFSSSSNSPYEFRGGIQHDGSSFSLTGSGAITFTTNNQTLSGGSAMTLNNATVTGINLTNSLTTGVTVQNTCTGSNSSSQWIQGSNGILYFQGTNLMPTGVLNAGSNVNTVNYNGATQNILGVTYYNLGCQGSNTKTLTQNLICGNDLTINAGVTFQAATFNVITNNIVNSGAFSKNGAGSVFAGGVVTLNGTGLFSAMTGNPSLEFQGGIVLNSSGASNFGAGTAVFSLNDQNISGSGTGSLTFGAGVILNDGVYVSNQKTVNISGNLDAVSGSSYWNNDNGSVLNYAGAQVPFSSAGSLLASTNSNTVNYNGANQTIRTASYFNLGILGSGIKTLPDVTVSGSFSHTAGTLNASGTQTFNGGSAATITTSTTTLNNVVLSKSGSSLTLAGNLTVANLLTLTSGTLAFGSVARTLTVNGDLSGSGTIDMSGIAGNSLVLSGANNTLGTYTSVAGNSVTYNRAGPQTIFTSPNYRRLSLGGSGTKSPAGNISVSDTLYFTADVLMSLGSSNLTLNSGSRIRAGASGTNGAFGVNRMILTGGSGSVIRRGTSTSDFTGFGWSSAGKNAGLFPVGTTGFYSPCEITGLTATIAGTASISVNAIATKLPTVPFYFNSLSKYWELSSTNLSAISANMRFTYNNPAEVVGIQTLYQPRVWDGSSLSAPAGPSAIGANPFSTTGSSFISGQWTAVDITPRNAYYTYVSGEWNDLNIWTTDPSGSTQINQKVPEIGDQVFILNGDTVTNANNDTIAIAALEIENGAVLDLGSTTGHSLGPVAGSGKLRLNSINVPTANFNEFVAASGGTFEYYNLPAGTSVLGSGIATYNNLSIVNNSATSFSIVQNHNLTLNGNLDLSNSSSGNINYQISNTAGAKTLSLGGNLTVASGCSLTVGTDNAAHNLTIAGNLTNNGFIRLTNAATASTTPSNGYCNLTFTGPVTNTVLQCNAGGQTRFHNLTNQKNTGYELLVQADSGVSPQFWASGRNIDPQTGTLHLGANVVISPLGDVGGNFDIGSSTSLPTLWIDGASIDWGGGNSIVGYGTLRVSAGTLNVGTGAASIVLREAGQFIMEGGTVNAQMLRTSNTATTHRGAFIQSGGTLNLNLATGSSTSGYSVFTLPYGENVFKMSGGVINITKLNASNPAGGIQIGSTAENYDVTGGTVNITTTSNANFDISSGVPFYNLTISRSLGSTAAVRLNAIKGSNGNNNAVAMPLVVLNDFTINTVNSPVFNAQSSDVRVGGNLVLNSGATWQSAVNTLLFNGTGTQTFTNNGIAGLSSLQVNKLNGSTITLAGSASTITLPGSLLLTKGVLADGGKTINVAGNVFNEATHSGAGKIVLNSNAAAQAITGTSTATFGNLEISNTFGSAGSTQVTSSTNIRINGNLTLSTDRLFSVDKYEISLAGSSLISGSFSANRHISTNGLRSDAGIKKTFSSTTAFVFPFGSGGNYTPATIQFSSAPSTWGTLDVRPVATKQLYVTDPDAFSLYWRVKTSGFVGVPSNSVNYTYGYGNLSDNTAYIPAYYNDAAIAYTAINDVSKVDETSNTISFPAVSYTDGDYTAGNPAAFGIVIPFYSRASGNWNSTSTWSNAGFGGAAASGIPASNSPVLIGNGSTFNHTLTVGSNNTISGSLIVDAGSVLDLQTTTGNNFGAIPYATAGGSGKIRISSASPSAVFPAGDFGLFFLAAGGTTEYYSTGAQNFLIPSVTDAPNAINIDTYRNLVLNPGSGNVIALPEKNLLVYGNLDLNGNSTGKVRLPNGASRNQTIKGNLLVTSGILEFSPAFAQTISLEGNASVLSNGTMQSVDTGSVVHTLALSKNMLNEGSILFNRTSKVNMKFQSDSARVLNGSNPSSTLQIGQIQVSMGTSPETTFEITSQGTVTAPTNNWLTISKGTLKISRPGTFTLTSSASNFTVPAAGGLVMNNSGLTINVGDVNSASADLILGGNLYVLAGTLNVGNNLYNQNNDIEYANSGFPEFKVAGNGQVYINGQIRRSINTQQGSLIYTQQDNSVVSIRGKNTDVSTSQTYDRAKFEILNPGSQFNMSGNSTLTIDRSGNPSGVFFDVFLQPTTSNVTGGIINIGTAATPVAQTFYLNTTVPLWSLVLNGNVNPKTLVINGNPLVLQDDLMIFGSSVFNTNGQNVTIGGDFVNQNPTSTAGLAVGGYQPVSANQITTLNGTLASQNLTGNGVNLTNFANLVLNNGFTSGAINLGSSNTAVRVNGNLEINSGQFNTGANLVTVLGNLVNNGGHTSSGAGFMVMAGSNQQAITSSTSANFGSLRITNPAGVDVTAPININGNLNLTTGILYISNNLMTLSATSAVTGGFGSSCMIRTNGVASDAGITRTYPASASDFTFPVGVTLKYTPVRVNVTSNTVAGSVNIKPINTAHPGTTDTLDKELTFYWKMAATGFNGSTLVNHTFNYMSDDALNGIESNYVTGRFLSGLWAPTQGISGTVNPAADLFTLTGVNYFNGDFTAGEPSEFNILTTFYSRNATLGGNWSDPNSWSNDVVLKHAGAASVTYPNFNQVVIDSTHTITVTANGYNAVSVDMKGTLNLGNTLSHNFGTVSGRGTVVLSPTAGAQYIFPGGDFTTFVDTLGGTFEFSGNTNGTLPTQTTYNHVIFSGTGAKNMPNADVRVKGDFTLSSGTITNSSNRRIYLRKNWTNQVGTAGFSAGTGTVILEGTNQTLSGSTTFGNLSLVNAGDKTLGSSIVLTRTLSLTAGVLVTGANQVTINSTGSLSGGSATSYVNGTLTRGVAAASPALVFPIGDAAGYAPISLGFTGSTTAGGFISASSTGSEHPSIYTSGVHPEKNTNRYWTLSNSGVGGFTAYSLTLNHLPAELDVNAVPTSFVVSRNSASTWTLPTVGTVTSGSVQATNISGTTFGDFVAGIGIGGKIWTGTNSSDWNLASNWTPTGVPISTENALVGPTLNQPGFLSGSTGVCKSLYLLSGAGIDIPSGYDLVVNLDAEATGNTISGAGTLKVSGSSNLIGTLNVNSNLEITSGSSLTFASGSVLNLGRNLVVTGTMNPGTANVNMVGGLNTTVSGNANFYNLAINKSAGQNSLQLLSNISVANNLDMQSGDILLNGKDLDLGSTGTLLNETDSNRVGGAGSGSIRATRILNAPSGVNVAGLGVQISSSANLGSTEVIRRHDQIVYGTGFGINRRVEIHPTNNSALNATLVMSYYESELNTALGLNSENDLDLYRYNGSIWDKQSGTLDMASNTVTKTGIPQFSEWIIASDVNAPLAINLAYGRVDCEVSGPVLRWKLLDGKSEDLMMVEVSSDGENWNRLSTVLPSDRGRDGVSYSKALPSGIESGHYIRLRALRADGSEDSSSSISVHCNGSGKNTRALLSPNPGTGLFRVDFPNGNDKSVEMRVSNAMGQIVFEDKSDIETDSRISLDLRNLPAGIYRLQLLGDGDAGSSGFYTLVIR